jgi:hypothetical protein
MKLKLNFKKLNFKNYLLIVLLLFPFFKSDAQIILEHTFDSTNVGLNFYITDLGNNNSKYVFIDELSNSFSLYNLDGTPFLLNISTPEPILPDYAIGYITNTLFDCDSTNIEYAFMSYLNKNKPFRILRSDGSLLLQVDSARGPVCYGCVAGTKEIVPIVNTQEGAKLLLFKSDTNGITKTLVYGLCGNLPITNSIVDFSPSSLYVKVYPNPSSLKINFDVTLPNNLIGFEFVVFDSNAKELIKESIQEENSKFTVDLTTYPNGVYYYKLISNTKLYQSGKFILTK